MIKSLKSKITVVYISLVVTIALVGIASAISIYSLSKSINGLMTDNYKSIHAVNNMVDAIDRQNSSILNYIYSDSHEDIDKFYKENDNFYKWYNIEDNNITEPGEKDQVKKINDIYKKHSKVFAILQENRKNLDVSKSLEFYDSKIVPVSEELKKVLLELSYINETAMFAGKNEVIVNARQSASLVFIISFILVIGSFTISKTLTNKFLKPIYALTETVKSLKEGDLNQQAPVISEDEIGDLAIEFNKMTRRLMIFEQSTKGELLNEKNKSLAIVKSISDPLIVLDNDYKILLLNDSCEKFFHVYEDSALNKHLLEVIRNGNLYDYISKTLTDKLESNSRIMNFYSDDKDFYFNVLVTTVKDTFTRDCGVVVLFQNVTQLKHLEKMKTDFISTISHEFKTPLTSIMIGTSLLIDEDIGELNHKQQEVMETIKEDGEKLTHLVNNLLQLSKLESDKSIFSMRPVGIDVVIQNCLRVFYGVAENNEVNISYQLDEHLPKVNIDSEKISWVINNLVSNALKFTNAGDDIEVSAYLENEKIYVSVKDTGSGIPDEYMERIFDKFFQVKENDIDGKGTGLGLTIAKEIIDAHDGDIWCESKLDVGSTFTFTLPIFKEIKK